MVGDIGRTAKSTDIRIFELRRTKRSENRGDPTRYKGKGITEMGQPVSRREKPPISSTSA